jgi:peptidoglycan/LPS O-acetylase OafA/YrhL
MTEQPTIGNRIPSLDGLRAISIVCVLAGHLAGTRGFPLSASAGNALALGHVGVHVFFVISGFLITGLLLHELDRDGRIRLGRFYFRRTLRIFPPYYAFLAALVAAQAAGVLVLASGDVAHAVTYTSNYDASRSWWIGHTWSLGVEEQFYLLWPATLVLLGARRGLVAAGVVVLLTPAIRLAELQFFPAYVDGIGNRFETVADAIAIGCVLACTRRVLHGTPLYMRVLRSPLMALAPLAVFAGSMLGDHPRIAYVIGQPIANIATALVVDWAVTFPAGRLGRVLNARPLVAIGLISYSLYLWQQPFLDRASSQWWAAFPANLLLAVACAVASYFLVERPSFALRTRLEKRRKPASAPDPLPSAATLPAPSAVTSD